MIRSFVAQVSGTRRALLGAAVGTTLLLFGCATASGPDARRWSEPAESARAAGDLATAIALYEEALLHAGDDGAVRARLAALLIEQAQGLAEAGQLALAEERFARAREVGGDTILTASVVVRQAAVVRDAGRGWAAEAALLDEALGRAYAEGDLALLESLARQLALGHDERGDGAAAVRYYERLLELAPSAPLWLRAAQLQAEAGMDEAAIQSYRRYLDEVPGATPGLVGLAEVHERRGELEAAEALLVSAVEQAQRPASALRLLRGFYQRTGNSAGLASVDAQLAALAPDEPERKMRPLKERRR